MTSVTLLDGGMGQELLARSGDKPTPLWSTQVMIDHPGLVADIHRDYFKAGATVATTNSYAILRDRLAAYGNEDQFHELLMAAMAGLMAQNGWVDREWIAGHTTGFEVQVTGMSR